MGEIREVKKHIVSKLGIKQIKILHKQNTFLDNFALLGVIFLVVVTAFLIANISNWTLFVLLILLQGFFIQLFGLAKHDLFIHRKIWGKYSYIGELILGIPLMAPPSIVHATHLLHHKFSGTAFDSEKYKDDLDRWWKKWFFLTLPGMYFIMRRKLSNNVINPEEDYLNGNNVNFKLNIFGSNCNKVNFEKLILMLYLVVLVFGISQGFRVIVLGYLIPFIFTVPIASTFRTLLEHADIDKTNSMHLATYYKTNFFSRFLFFADGGDCHLVHHLFPMIPFYNIKKALILMRPILDDGKVVECRSLTELFFGWLKTNIPHGHLQSLNR